MGNARGLVLLVLLMSSAPARWAQEQVSKLELYGGYDYIRFNIKSKVSGQPPSQTFQGNGGGGELVYKVPAVSTAACLDGGDPLGFACDESMVLID